MSVAPPRKGNSAGNRRCGRRQQELRTASVALVTVRNIGVVAVVIEFTARPRWLQRGEFHVLPFDAHFEGVLAEDLGDVVGQLERGADFVGRQEGVAAEGLQAADAESRKTAIFLPIAGCPECRTSSGISRQIVSAEGEVRVVCR